MDPILGPTRRPRQLTFKERPAEIQYVDFVGVAIDAIERTDAREWFEADRRAAQSIAAECPFCAVFSPTGHLSLVHGPDSPHWRVPQSTSPGLRRPAYLRMPFRPARRLMMLD